MYYLPFCYAAGFGNDASNYELRNCCYIKDSVSPGDITTFTLPADSCMCSIASWIINGVSIADGQPMVQGNGITNKTALLIELAKHHFPDEMAEIENTHYYEYLKNKQSSVNRWRNSGQK